MSAALLKYLFPIIAVAVLASCKKNENSGTCKLKTVHIIAGQYDATTSLEYDAQERVVKATTTGGANKISTISYRNDTATIKEETGSNSVTHTVIRTAAGNIKDLIIRNSAGLASILIHYDYNSSGKAIRRTTTYPSGTPLIYTIAYNGAGDAINETNSNGGSTSILHDYDTDRNFQNGDAGAISDFISYGAIALTNNHLTKTTTSIAGTAAPTVTNNTYTFDNSGNISTLSQTVGSASPSTYDYTYTCD